MQVQVLTEISKNTEKSRVRKRIDYLERCEGMGESAILQKDTSGALEKNEKIITHTRKIMRIQVQMMMRNLRNKEEGIV